MTSKKMRREYFAATWQPNFLGPDTQFLPFMFEVRFFTYSALFVLPLAFTNCMVFVRRFFQISSTFPTLVKNIRLGIDSMMFVIHSPIFTEAQSVHEGKKDAFQFPKTALLRVFWRLLSVLRGTKPYNLHRVYLHLLSFTRSTRYPRRELRAALSVFEKLLYVFDFLPIRGARHSATRPKFLFRSVYILVTPVAIMWSSNRYFGHMARKLVGDSLAVMFS